MANLYQQNLSKRELFARVSHLSQICGPRFYTLNEGKAKGMAAVDIRTGGGLSYTVLLDRGLDIAWAEYKGIPLGYISKSGLAAPQFYCPEKSTWGESFTPGLLTTCGLMQVGGKCEYNGRKFSPHGNISNIPAVDTGSFQEWEGDEMCMGIRGTLHDALLYRENLEMKRTLTSHLGKNVIQIHDVVTNNGFERLPLMLLYHMNFGFPLIDRDTILDVDAMSQKVAGGGSASEIDNCLKMAEPLQDNPNVTFYHDLKPDSEGKVCCRLINKNIGLGIYILWNKKELWNFAEWKHLIPGDYVVGLEPCNNYILGILKEQENGTLEYIEPGESRVFDLEFGVFELGENK